MHSTVSESAQASRVTNAPNPGPGSRPKGSLPGRSRDRSLHETADRLLEAFPAVGSNLFLPGSVIAGLTQCLAEWCSVDVDELHPFRCERFLEGFLPLFDIHALVGHATIELTPNDILNVCRQPREGTSV